jgi:hypothetical protein
MGGDPKINIRDIYIEQEGEGGEMYEERKRTVRMIQVTREIERA